MTGQKRSIAILATAVTIVCAGYIAWAFAESPLRRQARNRANAERFCAELRPVLGAETHFAHIELSSKTDAEPFLAVIEVLGRR